MNQDALASNQTAPRRYGAIALSLVLWAASVVLTFFAVFALRDLSILLMAAVLVPPGSSTATRLNAADIVNLASMCIIVVLGMLGIGVLLVSGDYTLKHLGQPRLLRRLLALVIVEAVIVVPTALFMWS
jgi:hypothetical protein